MFTPNVKQQMASYFLKLLSNFACSSIRVVWQELPEVTHKHFFPLGCRHTAAVLYTAADLLLVLPMILLSKESGLSLL